mgnify:CR=1 FL=1
MTTTPPPTAPPAAPLDDAPVGWTATLREFLRRPVAVASAVVLLLVVVAAVAGPLIAPYAENDIDLARALMPPSLEHLFGTDELGRDVFSRVVLAAGVSVQVSVPRLAAGARDRGNPGPGAYDGDGGDRRRVRADLRPRGPGIHPVGA